MTGRTPRGPGGSEGGQSRRVPEGVPNGGENLGRDTGPPSRLPTVRSAWVGHRLCRTEQVDLVGKNEKIKNYR